MAHSHKAWNPQWSLKSRFYTLRLSAEAGWLKGRLDILNKNNRLHQKCRPLTVLYILRVWAGESGIVTIFWRLHCLNWYEKAHLCVCYQGAFNPKSCISVIDYKQILSMCFPNSQTGVPWWTPSDCRTICHAFTKLNIFQIRQNRRFCTCCQCMRQTVMTEHTHRALAKKKKKCFPLERQMESWAPLIWKSSFDKY